MILGMIMLMQSAEAAALAPSAVVAEQTTAPVWPVLAVLAVSLALAWRPRNPEKSNRR